MKAGSALLKRLQARSARVGVIGQGYVGLSLASATANSGMATVALDIDADRVASLRRGEVAVAGVDQVQVLLAMATERITFSTSVTDLAGVEVIVVCVPTPVIEHRPDLSAIEEAGRAVSRVLRPGMLIILESTTYPGTTEQVLLPILETSGLRAGRDFALAYSPERIDPGNTKYGLATTPRIVGGYDETSTALAAAFYSVFVDRVFRVSSCRAAELAKLLENTFRMVNIALVNELAQLCETQGIDTWEVIEAAATKPFGFMPFYPGPGVGGHCIPLDPAYLTWQSRRDTGRPYRLVETAMDINQAMPDYIARRIGEALNEAGKPLRHARILVLGVTYKPNVGDLRESAALEVLRLLHAKGAEIRFHDPYVEAVHVAGKRVRGVKLTSTAVSQADCVALLTPHDSFDLNWLVARASLVFDARNATGSRRPGRVVIL